MMVALVSLQLVILEVNLAKLPCSARIPHSLLCLKDV
jgi:hypothetical protein